MTRECLSLKNKPFLLEAAYKERLWGGSRLKYDFNKVSSLENIGEAWECSTHPQGPSLVASGEHKGKYLDAVIKEHPEYLGDHCRSGDQLPILIKLIDAKSRLSIQVHPCDEFAKKYENNSLGKTEMWYVLDAARDAEIILGLYRDIDKKRLKRDIYNGNVEKHLRRVKVNKDDVFYVEAGTIHGIGEGVLIAEIQESSDITYRLYDYNRVDKNGSKRSLDIDKGIEAASLKAELPPRQPMRVLKYKPGRASELLCRCKYFLVERWLINTERCKNMVDFATGSNSFKVMLCVNGCGSVIEAETGDTVNFFKGDSIFVPANSTELKIHGRAQLLMISC